MFLPFKTRKVYKIVWKFNFLLIFLANMSGVSKIQAREIFDSRGNPTVEVDITTSKGE